jgi:hypothetical protein
MRVKRLLFAVVASVSMVGCAVGQKTGAAPANPCSGTCDVSVTVASCTAAGIVADPPTIHVAPGAAVMKWEIDEASFQAGWQFAAERGVFFKDDQIGEFVAQGRSPKVITFNNRHTTARRYEYGINIVNRNGQTCPTKDPFVANL